MKTARNIKMKTLIFISSLMSISLLTACGSSKSNPLEKYSGIQGIPANTNDKSIKQTAVGKDLFNVEVEGTNQNNTGYFIEGKESQVLIRITTRSASIQEYSVELVDFTNVTRPTLLATDMAGVYSLNWHPPMGTIAIGPQQSFKAKVQVTVTKATNALLLDLVTVQDLDISVSRDNTAPKILGNSLPKLIDEGVKTSFTVDFFDSSRTDIAKMQELVMTPYISANTEAYRANGSSFADLDDDPKIGANPKKISEGTYRFFLKILPDQLPLDRDRTGREIPAASEVDLCFQARVMSVANILSFPSMLCTKVRYAAQPPVIAFDEASLATITAGKEVLISVKVSSAHAKSVIVIPKPSQLIAELSGRKEVNCNYGTPEGKNSQICVIKWTPACVSVTTSASITVKADSVLNSKSKSTSQVKVISIQPSADCVVASSRSVKTGSK